VMLSVKCPLRKYAALRNILEYIEFKQTSQPLSRKDNKNNKLYFRPELLAGVGVAILPATGTAARTV
jgi:hypothetical protein